MRDMIELVIFLMASIGAGVVIHAKAEDISWGFWIARTAVETALHLGR